MLTFIIIIQDIISFAESSKNAITKIWTEHVFIVLKIFSTIHSNHVFLWCHRESARLTLENGLDS